MCRTVSDGRQSLPGGDRAQSRGLWQLSQVPASFEPMHFAVYLRPNTEPANASAPDYLIEAPPQLESYLASFRGPEASTGTFLMPTRDLMAMTIPIDLRQRLAVTDGPSMVVLARRD
jgi:hypothetical protein